MALIFSRGSLSFFTPFLNAVLIDSMVFSRLAVASITSARTTGSAPFLWVIVTVPSCFLVVLALQLDGLPDRTCIAPSVSVITEAHYTEKWGKDKAL